MLKSSNKRVGLCPSLHYSLPSKSSSMQRALQFFKGHKNIEESEQCDIREVRDKEGNIMYHTLQIGEYPRTNVDENLSKTLESLYNGGKIKEGILCTGRWFSGNGQKEEFENYAGKHNPEFEYQGERYVRVVSYPCREDATYSNGIQFDKKGTVRWAKVEPISFIIKNWDKLPKHINPEGNGEAKYFDLKAEEAITANIPFYPDELFCHSTMWQNSSIRGFLNGIDVRCINSNGNPEYSAGKGGNFTDKCNFFNEAFNLSREPIIEYTIPDSEEEISDDAFNGCITLKKLVIHPEVKLIGKGAFDGLNFKYAYRTRNGELALSEELPKNKDEYENAIECDKLIKHFDGFDYNILLQLTQTSQPNKLNNLVNLAEILSKNNFSIPFAYGKALVESEKEKAFYENSDFRFFKNEIPQINEILLNYSEEERLSFFKFANALGCFSKEKILDKNGRETQIILAQKASSLLAQLLKTDEMKLR